MDSSVIKCATCKENIIKETKYMHWLGLMHLLEFLHSEEVITQSTFEDAVDRLMTFKEFAFEYQNEEEHE